MSLFSGGGTGVCEGGVFSEIRPGLYLSSFKDVTTYVRNGIVNVELPASAGSTELNGLDFVSDATSFDLNNSREDAGFGDAPAHRTAFGQGGCPPPALNLRSTASLSCLLPQDNSDIHFGHFLCLATEAEAATPDFENSGAYDGIEDVVASNRFRRVAFPDDASVDLRSVLDEALDVIASALSSSTEPPRSRRPRRTSAAAPPPPPEVGAGNIVVYCQKGVSRSPSVVMAFLMRHEGYSFDEALNHVKNMRSVADPNMAFLQQLHALGHLWETERSAV